MVAATHPGIPSHVASVRKCPAPTQPLRHRVSLVIIEVAETEQALSSNGRAVQGFISAQDPWVHVATFQRHEAMASCRSSGGVHPDPLGRGGLPVPWRADASSA